MTAYQNLREYVETDGTNPYPHGGEFETIADVAVVRDLLRDAVAALRKQGRENTAGVWHLLTCESPSDGDTNSNRAISDAEMGRCAEARAVLARAEEQGVE